MPFNQGLAHLYNYDGPGRLVTDTLAGKNHSTSSCTGQDPLSGMECHYDSDFWSAWWFMDRDTFAYDEVGNRIDNGGGYTTGNRITAFAGCSYGTDADGTSASATAVGNGWTLPGTRPTGRHALP